MTCCSTAVRDYRSESSKKRKSYTLKLQLEAGKLAGFNRSRVSNTNRVSNTGNTLVIPRTAVTQQHTHRIVTSQLVMCCCLWNVKCTVVPFTVLSTHLFSQVLLIQRFNFNFSSQYVLLRLTSCNTIISCIILLFCATNLFFLFWCN